MTTIQSLAKETETLNWFAALEQYAYPVDLKTGRRTRDFGSEWFNVDLGYGRRSETIAFENRFREHAPKQIEPWFEVIYWKMASQGGRANIQVENVSRRLKESGRTAYDLWLRCQDFVAAGSESAFGRFQTMLFESNSIAVAFTFAAFCCPERFPMVDTRIARYMAAEHIELGFNDDASKRTISRYRSKPSPGVLTMSDWPFVEAWVEWCRATAKQLSRMGNFEWRPRDVEMAIFRAWGDDSERRGRPKNRPRFKLSFDGCAKE